MKLNCIIVDDSTVQRLAVSKLVRNNPSLNLIAEYGNALEAKKSIKTNSIDLIFLDIEMPVITGFDLLESLEIPCQIIVITGKTDHAVRAFDYSVTDYLHKPISQERLDLAVKRAVSNHTLKKNLREEEDFIFVKSDLQNKKIVLNELKLVQAMGDYIKLVTETGNHTVLSTMKDFEEVLPSDMFLRVHKSYIINLKKVEKFNTKQIEVGNTIIPLSRNKKNALVKILTTTTV